MTDQEILKDCSDALELLLKELAEKHGRQVGITVGFNPIQQAILAGANAALQQTGMQVSNSFTLQFVLGEVPVVNIEEFQKTNRQTKRKN